ncbi:hypothetical protein RUND412_005885 [Rhizina undulata]
MWDTGFLRLRCPVKPYPDGKKGSKSLVAAAATPENNFKLTNSSPTIAMDGGPHGPLTTLDGKPLRDMISSNPSKNLTTSVYNR